MTYESAPQMCDSLDPAVALRGLRDAGAVLIRRHGTTEGDYLELGDRLARSVAHHATGSGERDLVRSDKHVSTVNKGTDAIPLHREASYLPDKPDLLLFFCERPPNAGGQTTLCDGVRLLQTLPASTRRYVETGPGAGLVWTWDLPIERWSAAFGTHSPQRAAGHLNRLRQGLPASERLETRFDGDRLHGVYRTRSVISTRFGRSPSFANSVMAYYDRAPGPYVAKHLYHVALADGSEFPASVLAVIRDCAEHITYEVEWRAGDILIVDNTRFMHGRRPVTDPQRRVLVRLGKYHPAPG